MVDGSSNIDDDVYYQVAKAMVDAGFLLIAAGAGFSADSGLPVYKDVAKLPAYESQGLTYPDLCDPSMLQVNPALFHGFWGSCYNGYLDTLPHEGYGVIAQWRQQLFGEKSDAAVQLGEALQRQKKRSPDGPEPSSCPFFVYTSNVDGHFRRFFSGREILEIHGSTDFWQCAAPCCSEVWTLPTTFRFDVDCDALTTAPNASHPAIVGQVKQISHYAAEPQLVISEKPPVVCGIPACIHCGNEARPNVLMFCDDGVVCSAFAESHYVEWECAMEAVLADQLPECCQVANGCDNGPRWVPGGLVIIEMGCGKNVPSVRQETENVLSDINRRAAEYGVAQCLLVRINPDFPNADHRKDPAVAHHVIGIRATALQALKAIDVHLQALLAQRT
eukprot:GGOE01018918.1.p1 GENE.GGOE01018918.1~~GGOE01018918.1.p1  ORF type:complete len:398 (-),score=71.69 GGOE01018918.1:158-1324(-)